jgi:uncharacterized protein YjgD (DUF1641 family)
MAQPIPLDLPARDPCIDLKARLEAAPLQHTEALLAAYDVLQGLHDCGALDLMRSALRSRDKILDIAVSTAGSPRSIDAVRNLLLLINMLGSIKPELLASLTKAVPLALSMSVLRPQESGLWRLVNDFLWNPDSRSALAAVNTMFRVFGRSVSGKRPFGSERHVEGAYKRQ